ncbi:MAG: EAL domain-containing protein [Proteobacteria bacterium]|nr:EAL domain-containing protein [Pseudomonadota bacterium]MCH8213852.1 EAL domain-containing protein [Pseudomonadota bacterium]
MTPAPSILLVEDDEDDYVLARGLLSEIFGPSLKLDWVETWDAGLEALRKGTHDICLADFRLGDRNGLELVREAATLGCTVPIILLTGQDNREIDLAAVKAGATDYLVKGEITAPLLDRAIRYAIERKKVEMQLVRFAQYDSLTGLANRSLFHTRLGDAIAHAKRTKQLVAVLLLDLDHFKNVNDSLGHPVGDMLLTQVSERLTACARETDTVARLGGDEFAVIATNITHGDGAAALARKLIDALAAPFTLNGQEVFTATSMGITLFPLDDKEPDQLLKNADMALYQAKAEGRGRYRFYDVKMNARAQARKTLEFEMRRALERHEFCLHFQPKINTFTGDLTGVEALIRWQHPERGMVLPGEFIPVAETTGLIVPLGDWVLHTACAQSVAWQKMGLPPVPVAVNVSAIQFKGTDFIDTVTRAIDESGIDPACLELELTESTVMDETEVMTELLHRLRDLRLNVAIDDFGTGCSSFLRLKELPVNKLKIDLSFVRNVTDDPANAAITKTIITLAKNLNLGVIAEGVETAEQFAFLLQHECQEVQGYYISRPLSGDQFTVWYGERLQNLAREG